jgi:hypothetical protein
MRTADVETRELAVQRCARDAEALGGRRDIAAGTRHRPLQYAALGIVEVFIRPYLVAEDVGSQ